ncbi:hypothetical protein CY0110_16672 [Crocosphaera chwakensis CCY0110]|uniref:Uncharacterized protein n=1 Tax=Crocosphaera chwakensis CCY0110 TaxID=391612 RepID=A3II16_9CHRO|nr:hypothetical protein CY0110_16672 [Crocosphaera chwakensis CCY0110]
MARRMADILGIVQPFAVFLRS